VAKKTNSGLPSGVSAVKNRPGLYRLTCMIDGERHSEYCRPAETGKKKLQSELQKAIDAFREKAERGALKGRITDRSRFEDAVQWYLGVAKLNLRESTHASNSYIFEHYIVPRLGGCRLREITPPMITRLLADLLEKGGERVAYAARPEFMEEMRGKIPSGKVCDAAATAGMAHYTLLRVQSGRAVDKATAAKAAAYFGADIGKAFERRETRGPLKATFVSRISTCLSAVFTALVKNDVLAKNPVRNATKPRVGEMERGAFLDEETLPIFLNALGRVKNGGVRMALALCLQLGLRSGEARGLRWEDVDFCSMIVSVSHSASAALNGLAIGEPKTRRSVRKLPLSPLLHSMLSRHKEEQAAVAARLGSAWVDLGIVCPRANGGIMSGCRLGNELKKIVKANPALPQSLHPHSLRHSFVSILIAKGLDVVNVAALAGDTVEVISRVYAHSFAERRAAAMGVVGTMFAEAVAAKPSPPMLAQGG
jgi:integrase